jgi:hypothetical protein
LPWWWTIWHWESVIAYLKQAEVYYNGGCQSELRTCDNWRLSWTYQYETCREVEYWPH